MNNEFTLKVEDAEKIFGTLPYPDQKVYANIYFAETIDNIARFTLDEYSNGVSQCYFSLPPKDRKFQISGGKGWIDYDYEVDEFTISYGQVAITGIPEKAMIELRDQLNELLDSTK